MPRPTVYRRHSATYAGGITFYLVVEEDPTLHHHDFPSVFGAMAELRVVLSRLNLLSDIMDRPTFHVADGGNKTRSHPYNEWYGFQGLMPLTEDATCSYLHEVIVRTGTLLLQLPKSPNSWHILTASDSICDYRGLRLLSSGGPVRAWKAAERPTLFLLQPTDRRLTETKVLAAQGPGGIVNVVAKPTHEEAKGLLQPHRSLWTLPFVSVWSKDGIANFVESLEANTRITGGWANLRGDFYQTALESLFANEEQSWLRRFPGRDDNQMTALRLARRLALRAFGERACKVEFALMPPGSFADEGNAASLDRRTSRAGLQRPTFELVHQAGRGGGFDLCPPDHPCARVQRVFSFHEALHFLADRAQTTFREDQQRGWILIEGLQGSGKSSLARALARELHTRRMGAVVVEEDWWHVARRDRDALRLLDEARWKNHRSNWHRWDQLFADLNRLMCAGRLSMKHAYDVASGETNRKVTLRLNRPGIVIYTGFYIADYLETLLHLGAQKLCFINLAISPDESLAVKLQRDRWRSRREILELDANVYRPAFENYLNRVEPSLQADVVLRVRWAQASMMTDS